MKLRNLNIVIAREYLTRVRKKSFLLITFLGPVFFAAVAILPTIIMMITDDGGKNVAVVDRSGIVMDKLSSNDTFVCTDLSGEPSDSVRTYFADRGYDIFLDISEVDPESRSVSVSAYSMKPLSVDVKEALSSVVDEAVEEYRIGQYDVEGLKDIMASVKSDVTVSTYTVGEDGQVNITSSEVYMGISLVLSMIIYMFIAMFSGMVMQSVIEEKASRAQWKDKNDATAGKKYITYNSICNFILFLGMIILYFYSFVQTGILTADIESLNISDGFFALGFNSFIFWCIFIGFACKLMIVPIHYGIINAQINSATPVSMLINGLILNIGGYGLIRFNIGVFSELYGFFAYILMILGVINIIYGACIAFSQTNIKKIITYLNLTQTGFILIGLSSLTDIGFEGALFHMISRSLIWTGLFMLIGSIYQRTKTLNIDLLGGLNKIIPICYNLGLIICLGALSIPFTSNFISEFMILNGLILNDEMPEVLFLSILTICLIGLIFVSGSILLFFNKTFYGETMSQFNQLKGKRNITKSEIIVFSLIALSIIFLGIFPNAILEIFDMTSDVIIDFLKV